MNLVALYIIVGLLGPLVYELGWMDCVCIVIFANAISCAGPVHISTFGPESANRKMVRVRAGCISKTHWSLYWSLYATLDIDRQRAWCSYIFDMLD